MSTRMRSVISWMNYSPLPVLAATAVKIQGLRLCCVSLIPSNPSLMCPSAMRPWNSSNRMELLQHRSRWGGAVHFALAASSKVSPANPETGRSKSGTEIENHTGIEEEIAELEHKSGIFHEHIKGKVGGLTNSYIPTASNNMAILKDPSFESAWCA
mmetsp:Transcript_3185/g.8793  ORF Transcript_3185/g.8793 Transcript_3185/m.8793 type:complete len:156 (+) Transcript_3185:1414-1881(+)